MGHVYVDMGVRGTKGRLMLRGVLVDTGATLTVLPRDVLEEIGAVLFQRGVSLKLGDGRAVEADVYACVVEVEGREATVAVATFEGATPVLGVFSLEALGLKVDPVTGKLEETRPPGVYYFIQAHAAGAPCGQQDGATWTAAVWPPRLQHGSLP